MAELDRELSVSIGWLSPLPPPPLDGLPGGCQPAESLPPPSGI